MTDHPEPPRHPGEPEPPSHPGSGATPPSQPTPAAPQFPGQPAPHQQPPIDPAVPPALRPPGQTPQQPTAPPQLPQAPRQPAAPQQSTAPQQPSAPQQPTAPQQPQSPQRPLAPTGQPPQPARATPLPGPSTAARPAPRMPGPAPSPLGTPPPATATSGGGKGKWIAGGALVALLGIGGIGVALSGGGDDGDDVAATDTTLAASTDDTTDGDTTATTVAATETTIAEPETAIAAGPASVQDLAQATVQVLTADANGNPVCVGSGSLISENGRILTNAHVIDPSAPCGYDQVLIAVTVDTAQVPEITYRADILTVDVALDLAVLQIAERVDGGALDTPFPTIEVGDSDQVQLGDPLRIFGYPTIGGDTITFTNGSVSGFTQTAGVGDRAWIKTDATIAGGNSGGAAVDAEGRLIGVPTQASAGDNTDIVDCRVLTDTNGDGVVNDVDQCIPIGGFINGIRPVALAAEVIAGADDAEPQRVFDISGAVPSVSVSDAVFRWPQWSSGIGDGEAPIDDITVGVAGQNELCFSFDYTGMADGAIWSALWFMDGEFIEEFSLVDITWNGGPEGIGYWVCALDEAGLDAGNYELLLQLEGETAYGESITLLPDAASPFSQLTFVNASGADICILAFSQNWASYYGLDELRDDVLGADQTFAAIVAPGVIDVRAINCDGDVVGDLSVEIAPDSAPVTVTLDGTVG